METVYTTHFSLEKGEVELWYCVITLNLSRLSNPYYLRNTLVEVVEVIRINEIFSLS